MTPNYFDSSRSDRDAEILARLFTLQGAIWRKRNKKEEDYPENKIMGNSSKVKVISFLHGTPK